MTDAMQLQITVPSRRLGRWTVTKIVADALTGSFCLLPRHIDFVSVLQTGILTAQLRPEDEERELSELFVATDSGVLVKRHRDVFLSVRRAVVSEDLEELQQTVRREFAQRDELELRARSAASKLEVGFVRRFMDLEEGLVGR